MNAVAPGFCANVNDWVAGAFGFGEEKILFASDTERERVHERILRIAKLEADFSPDCGHAKTISVIADAANHPVENAAIFRGLFRGRVFARRDFTKAERIEDRYRARAHGENIPQDAANAGGRALERLDVTRMIVRFDFERGHEAVPDVHDAGVFPWTLHDKLAAGG